MTRVAAAAIFCMLGLLAAQAQAQPQGARAQASSSRYSLLLKGGHVIDPKNGVDAVMDVSIADGKIAAVAASIDPAQAARVADVSGLYVVPGLIDLHAHVFIGTT
jgi:dihydroorotase